MSAETQKHEKSDSKLSPATLAIASAASMAAAIFVHEVWNGGAIIGAAITPIIVAIVSESLKKPTERLSAVVPPVTARPARRGRSDAPEAVEAQAVELQREDRFGIWEEEHRERERSPWHKLDKRHLRLALITGLIAFAVAAVALTASELVFGGSVGSSGERTTIFRGGGSDDDAEPATTTTVTTEEEAPAEEEQTQTAPQQQTETVPPATTPTTPPAAATPAPATTAPAPSEAVPGATQPAPATPVP